MCRLNGNKLNMLVEGVAVKLVVLIQFNGGEKNDWHQWKQPPHRSLLAQLTGSTHSAAKQKVPDFSFLLSQKQVLVPEVELFPHKALALAWLHKFQGWAQNYQQEICSCIDKRDLSASAASALQPLVFKPFKNVGQFSKDSISDLASHWHLPDGQEGHLSDLWLFCLYLRWRKSFYGMRGRRGQKYLRHAKSGVDTFLKTNVLIISTHQTPDTVKC